MRVCEEVELRFPERSMMKTFVTPSFRTSVFTQASGGTEGARHAR